jgi:hypothetical protein
MNRLNNAVGLSRYERARFHRLLAAFPPLPESREGKGALVFELEVVGSLAIRTGLPFIKSIGQDETLERARRPEQ